MKETIKKKSSDDNKTTYIFEFNSINEFYNYICETPLNENFRWENLISVKGSESFTKTKTFEEASELLRNGSDDIAKQLQQKLEAKKNDFVTTTKSKTVYDVQGFQCCVPLYLQGVPNNMISRRNIKVKQKVITLTKAINYNADISVERMIDESIKALQLVKKIESQGTRCNLNIVVSAEESKNRIVMKVRLKSSTEKINVSKLAFCMVHPSMLRRMSFRFLEVCPRTTKDYIPEYGCATSDDRMRKLLGDNEYLIPSFISTDINEIKDLSNIR